MFCRKREQQEPELKIIQIAVPLDQVKTLDQVLDEVEEKFPESICPIELAVPVIPLKARALYADGRFFTPHNFEARGLLKSLAVKSSNPVNREWLCIEDVGSQLQVNRELIRDVDHLLARHGHTRKDLLDRVGVSQELFDYMLTANFSRTRSQQLRAQLKRFLAQSRVTNQAVDFLRNLVFLMAFFLSLAIPTGTILLPLKFLVINHLEPSLFPGDVKLLDLIVNNPSAVNDADLAAELRKALLAMMFQPAVIIPAVTAGSTLVAARGVYDTIRNRKPVVEILENKRLFLILALMVVCLIGLDAMTNCLGVVDYLTPSNFSKTSMGIAPAALVAASGMFGKMRQKSLGEIAFEKFERNGYEYTK